MYECWGDGSVRSGNPGIGGVGWVVKRNGIVVKKKSRIIGVRVTNNEAEYWALIDGLKALIRYNKEKERSIIYTDSKVVHGQVVKDWNINYDHLEKLNRKVKNLLDKIDFHIEVQLIGREENESANDLAQKATSDYKERQGNDGKKL